MSLSLRRLLLLALLAAALILSAIASAGFAVDSTRSVGAHAALR